MRAALGAWWATPAAPYVLSLLLQLALAPWFIHDWDGFVLIRSTQDFLAGTTPYETSQAAPFHIFLDDRYPLVNTWYAYPPLILLLMAPPVALAQLVANEPTMLRLAVKLPMILGLLLLGRIAGALAEQIRPDDARVRRRAELLVLLNPFLLFITAVWGMFDALMMAFLLLSVVLLHRGRLPAAGVAFGLATAVKIFPLFVAPAFLWHVVRHHGGARAARFVAAAVATTSIICLPFFLGAPQGFLEQLFFMHGRRGAQGFALVSFPLQLQNLNNLFGWRIPILSAPVVESASTVLLALTILLVTTLAVRTRTTQDLLRLSLAILVTMLLVSKVVNEQYLVMPVALLALLHAVARRDEGHGRALRAFTYGGLVSSVLIGLHFLTFLPPDVAPVRPDEWVQGVAHATGLPVLVVFSIPHALALLALLPALLHALRIAAPAAREAAALCAQRLQARLHRAVPRPRVAAVALLLLLLVAPPVTTGVLALPDAPRALDPLPDRGLLLARYDLAVHNPSHDPAVRDGSWARGPYPEPADGFYSANTAKVRSDLAQLREAGVDVVLVGYSAGNRLRLETFLALAHDAGLHVAPVLDVSDLQACPDLQRVPPSRIPPRGPVPDSARPLLDACVDGALRPFAQHVAVFRPDGRPLLFLQNATAGPIGWRPPSSAYVLAGLAPERAIDGRAPAWADAVLVQPPWDESLELFRAATRAQLGREDSGGRRAASAFPATWAVPPEEGAYAVTWQDAIDARAEWVVVPWNLHAQGSALEPLRGAPHDGLAQTLAHKRALQSL